METKPTPASQPPASNWENEIDKVLNYKSEPSPARSDKDAERAQPVPGLPFADLASGIRKFEADRAQESAPSSEPDAWAITEGGRIIFVARTKAVCEGWLICVDREIIPLFARRATAGNAAPTEAAGSWSLNINADRTPFHAELASNTATTAPGDLPTSSDESD